MFDQIENLRGKYIEIGKALSDPATMSDMKRYTQLDKEYRELENLVAVYDRYKMVLANIDNNKNILNTEKDEDFRDMAKVDLIHQEEEKEKYETELKSLLVPKDPEDDRNVLIRDPRRGRWR
jgi:peptide chain release factor 1